MVTVRCHVLVVLCGSLLSCTSAEEAPVSNLKSDERIVFFSTDAHLADDGRTWTVPIHAWVHELESTSTRKAAFAVALKKKYGLEATAETSANFDRRTRLFVVDNERGKRVVIQVAGKTFALPATGPNGHASIEIELDAGLVSRAAQNGKLTFSAVLPATDKRTFAGAVNLIPI